MGNFLTWIMNENIEENPGEYHYTNFDDFLSGDEYEKKRWIAETKISAGKLAERLLNLAIDLINTNTNHKKVTLNNLSNKDVWKLNYYVTNIMDQIVRIENLLSIDTNDFLFKDLDNKLSKFKINTNNYNLAKKELSSDNFKLIDNSINFINRLHEILVKNKDFKRAIYSHQLDKHSEDNIISGAKSIVDSLKQFTKEYPNAILGLSIFERGEFNQMMEKLRKISNGESVKDNYNAHDFIYFTNHIVLQLINKNFDNKLDSYEDEIVIKLQNLQRAIERTHGRLKFEQFILEARQLFNMPLDKDPAHIHSISFDKAFGQGPYDIGTDESKEEWINSVRDIANKFHLQIETIITQIRNQHNDASCFKNHMEDEQTHQCWFYLTNISSILSRISHYHSHVEYKELSDLIGFAPDTGFGITEKWVQEQIDQSDIQNYFKPSVSAMINKILNWMLTIVKRGKEAKADINGHIFKNYDNKEVGLAEEFNSTLIELVKALNSAENKIQYSKTHSAEDARIFYSGVRNLWKYDKKALDLVNDIINGDFNFSTDNEKILSKFIYEIDKMLWHNPEYPTIQDILRKLRKNMRNILVSLNRKYGSLRD